MSIADRIKSESLTEQPYLPSDYLPETKANPKAFQKKKYKERIDKIKPITIPTDANNLPPLEEPIVSVENFSHDILEDYVFKAADFDALQYNIFGLPKSTNLIHQFPELAKIESFRTSKLKIDKNLVIRYIILAYDRNSPAEVITDYQKKKMWCAMYAGFQPYPISGLFEKPVDEMLKGLNKEVNDMIISYLRESGSNLYAQLKIGTDAYYNKLAQMQNQNQGETNKTDLELERIRGQVWEQCNKMETDLEKLAERFLKDKSPFLKESLFCTINNDAKKNLMISPEQRAFNS